MDKFYKIMIFLLVFGGMLNSFANFQQTKEIERLKKIQANQAEALLSMAKLLVDNMDKPKPTPPVFNPDSIPLTEDTSKVSA